MENMVSKMTDKTIEKIMFVFILVDTVINKEV